MDTSHSMTELDIAWKAARLDPDLNALDTPDGQQAAWRLAVILGRARIAEASLNDDGELPLELALATASYMQALIPHLIRDLERLPQLFDQAEPFEFEIACLELLNVRHDLWAAIIALDEAEDAAWNDNDAHPERLGNGLEKCIKLLDQFDSLMEEQSGLLSVLVGTTGYQNLLSQLGQTYRENPPWWLDGWLEFAAKKMQEDIIPLERAFFAVELPTSHFVRDLAAVGLKISRTTIRKASSEIESVSKSTGGNQLAAETSNASVESAEIETVFIRTGSFQLAADSKRTTRPLTPKYFLQTPDGSLTTRVEIKSENKEHVLHFVKQDGTPLNPTLPLSFNGIDLIIDPNGVARVPWQKLALPEYTRPEPELMNTQTGEVWLPNDTLSSEAVSS